MEIEKQVTSLEVSVRLMDLGVKQESLFHWISTLEGFEVVYHGKGMGGTSISAFTVAELGVRIPDKYLKEIWKSPDGRFYLPGK